MYRVVLFIAFVFALAPWGGTRQAHAQAVPKSLQESGPEATIRLRKNSWTVGVAGGLIDGTYMRFADELAKALDDGDNLRILPIVSYGAASNLEDLLYLHGVDVAVTQADVFDYFKNERRTPNLAGRVHYLLRLPISELHILARDDIRTIEDLKGKKVNFGPAGSGSSLTGTIVFQRLGIPVQQVLVNQSSALQQLRSGEVSALVRVVNKPVEFFTKIQPGSGLHLLSVPFSKKLEDFYGLGNFTSKEYPGLIPAGETVDTIAVPAVLAVYNWPTGTERYKKVERFVESSVQQMGQISEAAVSSQMERHQLGGHGSRLDAFLRRGANAAKACDKRRDTATTGAGARFPKLLESDGCAGDQCR